MKPLVPILLAAAGLAGLFLGAHLLGRPGPGESPTPLTPGANPGSGAASLPGDGTPPAPAGGADARGPGAADGQPAPAHREPTPEERARIFRAVEEDRQLAIQEQARARVERQELEFVRRAEVIADRLSLPAGSAAKIAELYRAERARIAELREEFRAAGQSPQSREVLRTSLREARRWRDDQLALRFGSEVAEDIAKFEDQVKGEEQLIDREWKSDQPWKPVTDREDDEQENGG